MRGPISRASIHVVRGMGNASSSSLGSSLVLVDSSLELFEELINVLQVVLGAEIGHRQGIVIGQGSMGGSSHGWSTTVLSTSTTIAGKVLKSKQARSNGIVTGRVQGAGLDISKELVQSIKSGLLTNFVVAVHGRSWHRVVGGSKSSLVVDSGSMVGRWVGVSIRVVSVAGSLAGDCVVMVWVISRCCSSEMLQVSHICM